MAQAATVGGSVLGAASSIKGAWDQAEASSYNASMANDNARRAVEEAQENERQLRVAARKQIGSISAGYGASGVQMEGSALDVLAESFSAQAHDVENIKKKGIQDAAAFKAQAKMFKQEGNNAIIGGYLGAASSLLSGGAQASSNLKRAN